MNQCLFCSFILVYEEVTFKRFDIQLSWRARVIGRMESVAVDRGLVCSFVRFAARLRFD